ncbi:MAG: phosphoribosylaminoimidazolesuccinocarboxamide synthase [Candidatus Omnitrophica bacterium]|nr:phosphoribosylaminoimidazolesuccinocarboxamide synthase [Candidatus Omnitrophota bacterium]
MKKDIVLVTDFKDLKLFRRGKVRDVYDLGDSLLIVSTDRISCFDVVLPNGIPHKGDVLTQLSIFWFELIKMITPHHLITDDVSLYPPELSKYSDTVRGRSMLVKKTRPIPVECVVRGYISGSAWKEYKKSQSVCGIKLPAGLSESEILPEPVFTPSTKEDKGHDINVTEEYVINAVGKEVTAQLKEKSIAVYRKATEFAREKGIIIADTKFEFGFSGDGQVILIDEVLTPDSSRFWPRDEYKAGMSQPSFDKQFVRDYLESLHWDKTPPAPRLPEDIINKTSMKYLEAYHRLTGKSLV